MENASELPPAIARFESSQRAAARCSISWSSASSRSCSSSARSSRPWAACSGPCFVTRRPAPDYRLRALDTPRQNAQVTRPESAASPRRLHAARSTHSCREDRYISAASDAFPRAAQRARRIRIYADGGARSGGVLGAIRGGARVDRGRGRRCSTGSRRTRSGSSAASSTRASTASIATCAARAGTRPRSSGKASPATGAR